MTGPSWRRITIRTILVVGGLIAAGAFIGAPPTAAATNTPQGARTAEQPVPPTWLPAGGRIWTGVILWYGSGEQKMRVGEVLGGNRAYVDPVTGEEMRGVKIRYPNGSAEWKDRDAIVSGPWFVRRDDPAIERGEWRTYRF